MIFLCRSWIPISRNTEIIALFGKWVQHSLGMYKFLIQNWSPNDVHIAFDSVMHMFTLVLKFQVLVLLEQNRKLKRLLLASPLAPNLSVLAFRFWSQIRVSWELNHENIFKYWIKETKKNNWNWLQTLHFWFEEFFLLFFWKNFWDFLCHGYDFFFLLFGKESWSLQFQIEQANQIVSEIIEETIQKTSTVLHWNKDSRIWPTTRWSKQRLKIWLNQRVC